MRRRLITLAFTVALAAGSTVVSAEAAPDPTYPTGTFTVPETTEYVHDNDWEHFQSARVDLVISGLKDDTTPADQIVVRIYSGTDLGRSDNGEIVPPGTRVARIDYGNGLYDDPFPYFKLAGTYQPYVTLTDEDGNTTRVDLPQITLVNDYAAPVSRLSIPPRGKRSTMLAWRHLRGTVRDAGIDRPTSTRPGNAYAEVLVLQKRRGYWYSYQPCGPRYRLMWCKGRPTLAATLKKTGVFDIGTKQVGSTGWRSPYIPGLTRGPLAVQVYGSDSNLNGAPRLYTGFKITRRR